MYFIRPYDHKVAPRDAGSFRRFVSCRAIQIGVRFPRRVVQPKPFDFNDLVSSQRPPPKGTGEGKSPQLRISMPGAEHLGHVSSLRTKTGVLTEIRECDGRGAASRQQPKGLWETQAVFCNVSEFGRKSGFIAGISYGRSVSFDSKVHGRKAQAAGAGSIEKTVSARIHPNGFLNMNEGLEVLSQSFSGRSGRTGTLFKVRQVPEGAS